MFGRLQGRAAKGTQWGTGAVGNGVWLGVALSDVLTLAGITDDAESVLLVGLDAGAPEGGFRRVVTAEKAMQPDTLLAYGLNGELLARDHGFPLRALVPGWGRQHEHQVARPHRRLQAAALDAQQTISYVLIGDDYAPEGEAEGRGADGPVDKERARPPLARRAGEREAPDARLRALAARRHRAGRVERGPAVRAGASRASPGRRCSTRGPASTSSGRHAPGSTRSRRGRPTPAAHTQPDAVPFNEKGYLFNQPLPHPIRVV